MDATRPLEVLAAETSGTSYTCHRYCFEQHTVPEPEPPEDSQKFEVLDVGETHPRKCPTDVYALATRIHRLENPPIFRFFLDGSRRTYKVDDMEYDRRIFPILAGQLGVACTERQARDQFHCLPDATTVRLVLTVPAYADPNGPCPEFFNRLLNTINQNSRSRRGGICIDQIIPYNDNKHDSENLTYENIAIATLHEHMLDLEKRAVHVLANERGLLKEDRYLIKDGSLEYARSQVGEFGDLSLIRNNFRFVVGVSKSFNPEHCVDEKHRPNAARIASLQAGQRTPAFKFRSERSAGQGGGVYFVAWYLRLRGMHNTISPFDGVLKVELILAGDSPNDEKIDTEEIDSISAHLLLERLPTCYGKDPRWPNHLYPVHLTERYLKARFLGDTMIMNLL